MQTTHDFSKFCDLYNYDFQDELEAFKQQNGMSELNEDDVEVRVYDSGDDVEVSLHYFAGHDGGFKYTNTDGYVEVYSVTMPDKTNEDDVRSIVKELA